MEQYMELIEANPLFDGITREELSLLLTCISARIRSYEKGMLIFMSGQPADSVGLVCTGSVQVIKEDFMGNRNILAALSGGDVFGEAFACAKTPCLPVSVEAALDSEIMLMDYRKIITVCPASCAFHNRLIENMLFILARKNVMLNQKIGVLSHRTTREKLIAYLSGAAQRTGSQKFIIPFNRQELADYLCVERSAMSAEISKMRREGLLRTNRSEFELL